MTRKSFATLLKTGGVVFLLFVLLFADGIWATPPGFIGSILREIATVCRDTGTQWMLVLCLACYFTVFLILERRVASTPHSVSLPVRGGEGIRIFRHRIFLNPNLWLSAFVVTVLLRYALTYETAASSLQIPVLMAGIVFGKAIEMWVRWQNGMVERRSVWLIGSLVCLLAVSALWQSEKAMEFQYHGIPRWSGVWDNPNLYGLLMGVGVVLSVGLLTSNIQHPTSNIQWRKILWVVLCFFVAMVTGYGLFKSYSRGAWLGAGCGLAYLAIADCRMRNAELKQAGKFSCGSCISWLKKNRLPLVVVLLSVAMLGFWQLRFSESRPIQRLFSVGNMNDFSWRNRVTAWEGAVRMMADRPWIGFGWGQAETDYGKKYCPSRLNESAAIEMNDYLMIGISAGVPAMICFVAYIWFSLKQSLPHRDPLPSLLERSGNIQTICRAGVIVLLVGFWFDGGLFKLSMATVFWTLMELSRIEPEARIQNSVASSLNRPNTLENGNQSEPPHVGSYAKKELWLRWLAGILAMLAAAQTIVYVGTPLLPVGDRTLAIARKCLIQRKEANDFEFLSANAVWRGQKLKVLLEHVRLANYNRQLINWQLDDKIYRDFVLSLVIEPSTTNSHSSTSLTWRRFLWEEFYPRIRHESTPEDAAKIVAHYLRDRVTIVALPDSPQDVPTIWQMQITDEQGFEITYVAALRSVGVPARLDSNHHAEFWNGNQWQTSSFGNRD